MDARTVLVDRPVDARSVLMRCAVDARDPTVIAFASAFAAAFERDGVHAQPIDGLDERDTRRVLERWFPGAAALLAVDASSVAPVRCTARHDEFDDLVALFIEHADPRAGMPHDMRCVARLLASACFGENHLWQDLALPSRRELSALIAHWFPRLSAKNTNDMKWKKFFYKQLCEREGLYVCRAPSCGVCSDYAHCFGAE